MNEITELKNVHFLYLTQRKLITGTCKTPSCVVILQSLVWLRALKKTEVY